jgi:hypothetical protein
MMNKRNHLLLMPVGKSFQEEYKNYKTIQGQLFVDIFFFYYEKIEFFLLFYLNINYSILKRHAGKKILETHSTNPRHPAVII